MNRASIDPLDRLCLSCRDTRHEIGGRELQGSGWRVSPRTKNKLTESLARVIAIATEESAGGAAVVAGAASVTPRLSRALAGNARWESISRTLAEQPEGLPLVWPPSRASQRPRASLLAPARRFRPAFSITSCPVTGHARGTRTAVRGKRNASTRVCARARARACMCMRAGNMEL